MLINCVAPRSSESSDYSAVLKFTPGAFSMVNIFVQITEELVISHHVFQLNNFMQHPRISCRRDVLLVSTIPRTKTVLDTI